MQFQGKYAFLSNMYEQPITYKGHTYSCVEAAFQAQKTTDESVREKFEHMDGYEAKKAGKSPMYGGIVELRPDWKDARIDIMRELIDVKFSDDILSKKLASITEPIQEDNTWNDSFWGVCNGRGQNWLGRILTDKQAEIQESLVSSVPIEHGDICDVTEGVIVHQVNCRGRIGAGVSGALIRKWPEVKASYQRTCAKYPEDKRLGLCVGTVVEKHADGTPKLMVCNSFSQFNYGNAAKTGRVYTNTDILLDNVQRAVDKAKAFGLEVYVPDHIGCGLAGGNWREIGPRLADMGVHIVSKDALQTDVLRSHTQWEHDSKSKISVESEKTMISEDLAQESGTYSNSYENSL